MNDLIVLSSLLDGPKHGYQIKKQAGRILGPSELQNNLVYPVLRKFTAEGWVTRDSAPGERGQTRQQYTLTAAGRRALIDRLAQFGEREAQSGREFTVRVGLFDLLDAATCERILGGREQVLACRDEHLARLQRELDLGVYGSEVVSFLRQTIADEMILVSRLRKIAASKGSLAS